jgi:hypothetical protein
VIVGESLSLTEQPLRGQYRLLPQQSFIATAGCQGFRLTPSGPGVRPRIAPLDKAIPIQVDLNPVAAGNSINAVVTTASMAQDPGGVAVINDVTSTFIQSISWSGALISLWLGSGSQVAGQWYRLNMTVTLAGTALFFALALRCEE